MVRKPRGENAAETCQHGEDDGCGTNATGKPVGVREEITFQRWGVGIEIMDCHGLLSCPKELFGVDT